MLSPMSRLIRLASVGICIIVAASFLVFAVDQTRAASHRQTETLEPPSAQTVPAATGQPHKNSFHRAIDDAAEKLTSPFSGVISASTGEWGARAIKLLLALVVYGFGLGYLARALRVHV